LETSEYGVTSLNREIAATMAQLGDQHARGEVGGEFCRRRESNPGNDHGRGGTTASLKWTNPNLVWGLQNHEGLLKKNVSCSRLPTAAAPSTIPKGDAES